MIPDFKKYKDGLLPVIVQDAITLKVLMLGFMNEEAYAMTMSSKRVCFFSRRRQGLWTKGETSGNFLTVQEILPDCDNDTLLIKALPAGPVCHTGADTCFNENNDPFNLIHLEHVITQRREDPSTKSYTSSLFNAGLNKIAQKVGEEAVELVIESVGNDENRFLDESADLLFHYLVLLNAKGYSLDDVVGVLRERHR